MDDQIYLIVHQDNIATDRRSEICVDAALACPSCGEARSDALTGDGLQITCGTCSHIYHLGNRRINEDQNQKH